MNLSDSVETIPLVGKSYGNKLKKLDVETVEELLHHYPFRYDDFSKHRKINELIAGETVTVTATVLEIKNIYTRGRKRLTKATVADETGQLEIVWFNQPYITNAVKKNNLINLSGRLSEFDRKPALVSPEYEVVATMNAGNGSRLRPNGAEKRSIHTGRLVPTYPETRGVTSKWLRSRINHILSIYHTTKYGKYEFLPEDIRERRSLINLEPAINQIHFPKDQTEIDDARKRLAFDEFFLLQLQALKRRQDWQRKPLAHKLSISNQQSAISNFIQSLPFTLTKAQTRAINEILKDLSKDVPMNRLLEGDVGSGKTVVATAAIYAAHLNGFQSALMAPTEVLAEQHFRTISNLLKPLGVSVSLRTGSTKGTRQQALGNSKEKETSAYSLVPSALIGTHALLFDHVEFDKLGLVIIDEQHRFGVEQRAKLLKKRAEGPERSRGVPHLLTMTATPIPRSMALTIYGDLDLSVLDEMPPGRKEVITWVVPNRKRTAAYNWIREQINDGAQAFIICPLIEESEAETMQSVKAATAEFEKLSKEIFPDLRLALLHGKIKSKEKNEILTDFKNGNYDILVSTQVVEVGIDVPTATLMMIEGAERFGLASLHQLRGRVGRSDRQSYCLLFTESRSRKAYNRLKAMEELNDGFKLAEVDLKVRGPGEIYGTKQHGIMNLKLASLSDVKLIETTRNEAKKLLDNDPKLSKYPNLKKKLERMGSDLVEPN